MSICGNAPQIVRLSLRVTEVTIRKRRFLPCSIVIHLPAGIALWHDRIYSLCRSPFSSMQISRPPRPE